jgi:hypothetical protein
VLSISWATRRKLGKSTLRLEGTEFHLPFRLTELKKVMAQVHGGQYRWNWKKFKVAMRNMSCQLLSKAPSASLLICARFRGH